jgi:hypothetical protein
MADPEQAAREAEARAREAEAHQRQSPAENREREKVRGNPHAGGLPPTSSDSTEDSVSSGVKTELTWDSWKPYQDRYGLIHSKLIEADHKPKTGNGLLYTAEACVIMQLRNVAFDTNAIAATLASCQLKPGLFCRDPSNDGGQDSVDDYIGVGALAGICGFHGIARDILNYGDGGEQALRDAVLGLDFVKEGKGWLALLKRGLDGLQPGRIVPYNYNNVEPGKFTLASWMGRYPALIIHWKLAAEIRPNSAELVIWSATLLFSAHQNKDTPRQDSWLQSWLMVLTYQTSGFRSAVADAAVAEWWKLMRERFPGGIKQAMKEYLADDPPIILYGYSLMISGTPSAPLLSRLTMLKQILSEPWSDC